MASRANTEQMNSCTIICWLAFVQRDLFTLTNFRTACLDSGSIPSEQGLPMSTNWFSSTIDMSTIQPSIGNLSSSQVILGYVKLIIQASHYIPSPTPIITAWTYWVPMPHVKPHSMRWDRPCFFTDRLTFTPWNTRTSFLLVICHGHTGW